jgi:hypothetical protein
MLAESYQKLSPWLCSPFDRKSRAYLETHLDLLSEESDQFLALFIEEHKGIHDEHRRLRMMRHLLRDAVQRGRTCHAVREAYINLLGGLILDPPEWLQEIEQEWSNFAEDHWTDRRLTVCKLHLRRAIECAQTHHETPAEVRAELQYELGNFFVNDPSRRSTVALETAIELYTAALEVYTAERYPLRCALILLTLGDVYRRLADNQRADLIMQSLHYYSKAMALYEAHDLIDLEKPVQNR